MSEPTQNLTQFITQSYQLVSSSSPTVTLHGNDLNIGLMVLNSLLLQYSANGLMITVSQLVPFSVGIGQGFITFGEPDVIPTPDVTVQGRLVNLENAWVQLDGITYPLIDESRSEFYSSYKYEPLMGLPRYIIVRPDLNLTTVQIFPAPSQVYDLFVYGKFQVANFTLHTDFSLLPTYFQLFLQFALAKYLAVYKGRAAAWTPLLEEMYTTLEKDMVAVSATNVDLNINQESWLNGAWRVRAGI
jgi:hypothetical protein